MGANADFTVDSYAYNPNGGENNAALKIVKGAARFVAGSMERTGGANALKINTPVATIGIRGTDFFVEADQSRSAVALFSGFDVAVSNAAGTTVLQPGQGTDVVGTGAPTAARPWAPDRINRALGLTAFTPSHTRPLPYVPAPATGMSLADAITGGVLSIDARLRTESVDMDSFPRTGEATTLRLRVGYETQAFNGFYAGVSGQITRNLARPVRSDGVNGRTDLPLIPDPAAEVLHEGYLGWVDRGDDGVVRTRIIAGRQRLLNDNERWIGPSEFRQNAQSFDAVSLTTNILPNVALRYAYLWQINRIFGNNTDGRWDSNSHLIGASANLVPYGLTTAYAYLLDFRQAPLFSSSTYGLRYDGTVPLSSAGARTLALTLEAEVARQTDYGRNPGNFGVTYSLVRPGLTWGDTTLSAGWERLGSNGVFAVQTPLATLHRQNGWADIFSVTPARGLRDLHVRLMQNLPDFGPFTLPKLDLRYHDFSSAGPGGRIHYGREWDADLNAAVSRNFIIGFRAARYSAISFGKDTTKLWGYVEFHY